MNEVVKKNGITYGIIIGVISIVITSLIYAIDITMFVSMWLGLLILALYLVLFIVTISKTKKQMNGIISFKEAFTVFFIAAVIALTLSMLFNMLLFNVIDPSAKDTIKDLGIKSAVEMMEKFGTPTAQMEEAVAEMEKTDNYDPANLLKGWAVSLVVSSIVGLILAAIFKSKPAYKE